MRKRPVVQKACVVVAVVLLANACQRDVSGKYLAKYSDGICWLQLVRTPDNHLTAQLETDQLQPDGNIHQNVVALTGAANGDSIALSGGFLGLKVLTLAGSLEGDKLNLTGVQPIPLVLSRSDLEDYQRELKSLNSRSQRTVAANRAAAASAKAEQERIESERLAEAHREESARRAQNFVIAIDQMIAQMKHLNADPDLARFF